MLKKFEWTSLLILLAVCIAIASFMNLLNQVGWLQNCIFSLSFGLPIYILQHLMRSRKQSMADIWINIIAIGTGSCIGFTVIYSYLIQQDLTQFGQFDKEILINFLVGLLLSCAIFYFFWIRYRNQTLKIALHEQKIKIIEAESLRQKSENRLLQSQMEPHFLFNTLANIQSLIDIDSQLAKKMLEDLSTMLRSAIKYSQQDSCTVNAELQILRAYLSIQQTRMGERLQIKQQIDSNVLECILPPMLLQPIVENSIKHGLEQSMQVGEIDIQISIKQQQLIIKISDNFTASTKRNSRFNNKPTDSGHGLSLYNIEQRLQNQYAEQARFSSQALYPGWQTKLSIPISQPRV